MKSKALGDKPTNTTYLVKGIYYTKRNKHPLSQWKHLEGDSSYLEERLIQMNHLFNGVNTLIK